MRSLLVGLYLVVFLVCGLPVLVVEWLIAKVNPEAADKSQLWMVQHALRFVTFLSGVKLEVIGEENVPKDEPVLYIGNHRSYFDIVVTYTRVPRLTGYIAKNSINKIPSQSFSLGEDKMSNVYHIFLFIFEKIQIIVLKNK